VKEGSELKPEKFASAVNLHYLSIKESVETKREWRVPNGHCKVNEVSHSTISRLPDI